MRKDFFITVGNAANSMLSINIKEKLFEAKLCDLYTLPEPACLHSATAC